MNILRKILSTEYDQLLIGRWTKGKNRWSRSSMDPWSDIHELTIGDTLREIINNNKLLYNHPYPLGVDFIINKVKS